MSAWHQIKPRQCNNATTGTVTKRHIHRQNLADCTIVINYTCSNNNIAHESSHAEAGQVITGAYHDPWRQTRCQNECIKKFKGVIMLINQSYIRHKFSATSQVKKNYPKNLHSSNQLRHMNLSFQRFQTIKIIRMEHGISELDMKQRMTNSLKVIHSFYHKALNQFL